MPKSRPVARGSIRRYHHGPCEVQPGCVGTSDSDWQTAVSDSPYEELVVDGSTTTFPFGKVHSSTTVMFRVKTAAGIDGDTWSWFAEPYERRQYVYDVSVAQSQSATQVQIADGQNVKSGEAETLTQGIDVWSSAFDLYRWTSTFDAFENIINETEYGIVDSNSLEPVAEKLIRGYEFDGSPLPNDSWHFLPSSTSLSGDDHGSVKESRWTRFEYDLVGNVRNTRGLLSGTQNLMRFHPDGASAFAPLPPGASVDGEIVLGQFVYDEYGNVTQHQGPVVSTVDGSYSSCDVTTYKPRWSPHPNEVKTFQGGCAGTALLQTTSTVDHRFGIVVETVLPDAEVATVAPDPFGRPIAYYKPDPNSLSLTTLGWRIDYPEAPNGSVPVVSQTTKTEPQPGGGDRVTILYQDGEHLPVATLSTADVSAGRRIALRSF